MAPFIRIAALLAVLAAPVCARAQDEAATAFSSAAEIAPVSAPAPAATEESALTFSLSDADIVSWEENGSGRVIYVLLTPEKDAELKTLAAANMGKPLHINIDENFVALPAITSTLSQQGGMVLPVGAEQRLTFVHTMLDFAKKNTAATATLILDVEETAAPAAALAPAAGGSP